MVLHHIKGNEGAGAAEPRLAVDGDGSRNGLSEGEELGHDVDRRGRAVLEAQLCNCNGSGGESVACVAGLVEAGHGAHAELLKDVCVVRRAKDAVAKGAVSPQPIFPPGAVLCGLRSSHRDELAWDHYVQIGVERIIQLLVLVKVEAAQPTKVLRPRKTTPAMPHVEAEGRGTGRHVAIRH